MSTSFLYHTFGVWGYEYRSTAYGGGGMTMTIEQPRQALCCSTRRSKSFVMPV